MRRIRKRLLSLLLAAAMMVTLFSPAAGAAAKDASGVIPASSKTDTTNIKVGAEVLLESAEWKEHLRGKNVALFTNQICVDKDMNHLADRLYADPDINLVCMFGGEHGLRGAYQAGAAVPHSIDPTTGVPVWSLYSGGTIKPDELGLDPLEAELDNGQPLANPNNPNSPTLAMLTGNNGKWYEPIDVILFDLQEIGSKTWTYMYVLAGCMTACVEAKNLADQDVEFIVLDRPSTISSDVVEGTMTTSDQFSGISRYPLPSRYGLTMGELAKLYQGEGYKNYWVKTYPGGPADVYGSTVAAPPNWDWNDPSMEKKISLADCDLEVIPCEGYTRDMYWDETGLQFILPSPNMPTWEAALLYTGTVWFEGPTVSEGRGTTKAFELVSAPYIDPIALAERMNELGLDGVRFRAASITTRSANQTPTSYVDTIGHGVQIHITDKRAFSPIEMQTALFLTLQTMYGGTGANKFNIPTSVDLRTGSAWVREEVQAFPLGATRQQVLDKTAEMMARMEDEYEPYLTIRAKYLMDEYNIPDGKELVTTPQPKIDLGYETLLAEQMDLLTGKKVGLFTNQTGVDKNFNHLADVLNSTPGIELTTLFSPGSGLRGEFQTAAAGDYTDNVTGSGTGLPVHRLNGTAPTAEQLKDIDILLFDMQDSGTRSNSYVKLMADAMKACAANGVAFAVLDRPNPLGGAAVDGPVAETGYAIPTRHGMTMGELALMLRGEFEQDALKDLDLTVIPLKDWAREMYYDETGLQFIMSDAKMPTTKTGLAYAATGWLDGTGAWITPAANQKGVSNGWGTTKVYEFFGAPFIKDKMVAFADALNSAGLPGVRFRMAAMTPWNNVTPEAAVKFANTPCYGVQLHIYDEHIYSPVDTALTILTTLQALFPDNVAEMFTAEFDEIVGNTWMKDEIKAGKSAEDIRAMFQTDVDAFAELRKPYLLYGAGPHTVTFDLGDSTEEVEVAHNAFVEDPRDADGQYKGSAAKFYADSEFQTPWNFKTPITKDTTIFVQLTKESQDKKLVRVMTYNIQYGNHGDGAVKGYDLQQQADIILASEADVVFLQEVDVNWGARSNYEDTLAILAEKTDMNYFNAYIYDKPSARGPEYPNERFGVAFLSKYPIESSFNHPITRWSTQPGDPQPGEEGFPGKKPGFGEILININGLKLRAYNTHLDYRGEAPSGYPHTIRLDQVRDMLDIMDTTEYPTILAGDMNADVAWANAAEVFNPLLEKFTDVWAVKGRGDGNTYPAVTPDRRIDYLLTSSDVEVVHTFVVNSQASDHRPVVADLLVRGSQTPPIDGGNSTKGRTPEEILADMTLDQKIGQMIMPDFRKWKAAGTSAESNVTALNDEIVDIIDKYEFGGVILFAENVVGTEQTRRLTTQLQSAALKDNGEPGAPAIPMFITIDQEGGIVYRLGTGTALPGNMAIGATRSAEMAEQVGQIIGRELNSLGINVNFAPSVDVNNNPENPVIGLRSVSSDPNLVAELTVPMIRGMNEYNIASAAKHFPGHGDTDTDSHYGLPMVDKSFEELKETELVPFKAAVEAGVDMLMTAHITFPQIDDSGLPATVSGTILNTLAREYLDYDGIIITDALNMQGVATALGGQDKLVVGCFKAGVDIALMPVIPRTTSQAEADLDAIFTAVKKAIADGELTMEQIDKSVMRILELKKDRGILDANYPAENSAEFNAQLENAKEQVGSAENRELERDIAAAAITIVKNEKNLLPIQPKAGEHIVFLTPYDNEVDSIKLGVMRAMADGTIPQDTSYAVLRKDYNSAFTGTLSQGLKDELDKGDYIVVVSETTAKTMGNWIGKYVKAVTAYAKEKEIPSVVVTISQPYDLANYPDANALLAAFGAKGIDPTESGNLFPTKAFGPNLPAAIEVLLGNYEARGKLPVDLPAVTGDKIDLTKPVAYPFGTGLTYGPPVDDTTVLADVRVPAVSTIGDAIGYTISLRGMKGVMNARIFFEVDGNMLSSNELEVLQSTFSALDAGDGPIRWTQKENNIWAGEFLLMYLGGGDDGFTSEAAVDIAKVIYTAKRYGDATMRLTGITIAGKDESGEMVFLSGGLGTALATTSIVQTYSVYDLNKDGLIDERDLAMAQRYYQARSGDANWNAAKVCDFNNDGVVDMLDLIDLFLHFTK